jgi:nitroreductase
VNNPILEAIFKRRSIRHFTDKDVSKEDLETLLKAAMSAPSAVNSQPWEFYVITEPGMLEKLRSSLPFGRYKAPAAFVVCGHPLNARNPAGHLFWQQDCSAAIENMLIAAVGLGLGTVWIGIHPVTPFVFSVRRILKIPRTIIPMALVYVGHPAEEKPHRTRFDEKKVHWYT